MKINLVLLFLLGITITAFAQTKTEKLDQLLTAYTTQYQFNGTALVSKNGVVLLHKGYGFKNVESKSPNNENTIFQIGSITKQFTATVILKLAEQHKLNISDKLSKYYPNYPKGDSITIEHLLTHTSGVFNYTNDVEFMKIEATKPATEAQMLALFKDKPLDFSPGTRWSYSNSGYMLLGYIIQKVTQKPYEEVVHETIFKPLGMTHTGFDFVRLKNHEKATGYFVISETSTVPSTLVDSTVSFAAGAIYSTTGDLLKWHSGILNNKIVQRSSMDKAFTPYKNNYGYGWAINKMADKQITTHSGGIFGFNANLARIEQDDVCVLLLNNVGNPKLSEITQKIFEVLYDKPYTLPEIKKEVSVSEDILKKYVGTYEVVPAFQIVVTVENGRLVAQATGQPKFELFAQKDNYFFLKAVEAEIEFANDEKGIPSQLFLYQGGRKTPAKKIK